MRGRKRQKFITGAKSSTSSSFKGVQQTKDFFIGRCELSVSVEKIELFLSMSSVLTSYNENAFHMKTPLLDRSKQLC